MTDETTPRVFRAVAFCSCGALLRLHERFRGNTTDMSAVEQFRARHDTLAILDGTEHRPATEDECRQARRAAGMTARIRPATLTGIAHDPDAIDRELPR